jgi:hypothetical protein
MNAEYNCLDLERDQWRQLLNTVINIPVLQTPGIYSLCKLLVTSWRESTSLFIAPVSKNNHKNCMTDIQEYIIYRLYCEALLGFRRIFLVSAETEFHNALWQLLEQSSIYLTHVLRDYCSAPQQLRRWWAINLLKLVQVVLCLAAVLCAASGGYVAGPADMVCAPSFESAIIKSDCLEGNFPVRFCMYGQQSLCTHCISSVVKTQNTLQSSTHQFMKMAWIFI